MIVLRYFGYVLLGLLALAVFMLGWASWAWRDIPVAELEQKYGGPELRTRLVDDVALRFRVDGPLDGSRPVVVLVHSHYFDMGMWDAWVTQLATDFTVLRYDLTGHGLTGPDPTGIYTVARDIELLEGLLVQLGVGSFSIVGSSLGGNIAFTFAAAEPERIKGLVLVNSGGLKRNKHRSGKDLPAWGAPLLDYVPPSALHKFLEWMAIDDATVNKMLVTRFVDLWRREGNREAEYARLRQFETGDPDPLLARITAPTLILWGEDNPQLPVALSEQFEQKLSSSKRVERKTYPGTGHMLPLERPRQGASDTRRFLLDAIP